MPKVYIYNHEPIGVCPVSEQYWSDVWLTYTQKPRRRKKRIAPTLISITELARDLEIDEEIQKKNPDLDLKDQISRTKEIIDYLATNKFADDVDSNPNIPNIYTSAATINRAHAEEMLNYYLSKYGMSEINLKWRRAKQSLVIIPT